MCAARNLQFSLSSLVHEVDSGGKDDSYLASIDCELNRWLLHLGSDYRVGGAVLEIPESDARAFPVSGPYLETASSVREPSTPVKCSAAFPGSGSFILRFLYSALAFGPCASDRATPEAGPRSHGR